VGHGQALSFPTNVRLCDSVPWLGYTGEGFGPCCARATRALESACPEIAQKLRTRSRGWRGSGSYPATGTDHIRCRSDAMERTSAATHSPHLRLACIAIVSTSSWFGDVLWHRAAERKCSSFSLTAYRIHWPLEQGCNISTSAHSRRIGLHSAGQSCLIWDTHGILLRASRALVRLQRLSSCSADDTSMSSSRQMVQCATMAI
jgi:hypothetical protein